jgi:hypothetical protein
MKSKKKETDWVAKRDNCRSPETSTLGVEYAGQKPGAKMLISSAKEVDAMLRRIPKGKALSVAEFRAQLAVEAGADFTCPLTAGIFLRIAAEAAWQEHQHGASLDEVSPFWRVVNPKLPIAKKLACGVGFVRQQRALEGLPEA